MLIEIMGNYRLFLIYPVLSSVEDNLYVQSLRPLIAWSCGTMSSNPLFYGQTRAYLAAIAKISTCGHWRHEIHHYQGNSTYCICSIMFLVNENLYTVELKSGEITHEKPKYLLRWCKREKLVT